MPRMLAIGKRVSLADIYPGWTDEAYAIIRPASYADKIAVSNYQTTNVSNADGLEYELNTVKSHFVDGKVFVSIDGGEPQLDTLHADDLDDMVDVTQRLFLAMIGIDADPKDIQTPTATSPMPQDSSAPSQPESNTKTE